MGKLVIAVSSCECRTSSRWRNVQLCWASMNCRNHGCLANHKCMSVFPRQNRQGQDGHWEGNASFSPLDAFKPNESLSFPSPPFLLPLSLTTVRLSCFASRVPPWFWEGSRRPSCSLWGRIICNPAWYAEQYFFEWEKGDFPKQVILVDTHMPV